MDCFHLRGCDRGGFDGEERPSVPRIGRLSLSRSQSVASGSREETKMSGRDVGRNKEGLRVFGIEELKAATKGFSRSLLIGEGGFGCVYRGVLRLSEGVKPIDVAVKQLRKGGMQGHKEWLAEVNFLGGLVHPHLVKLIGYCAEDDERGIQRLLVYELMPNKSLEDHLFSRTSPPLPWPLRLKIALGAARGLSYLHQGMDFQLIFRDFKTSNVLLDEDFNAKLSDFGLAREGPNEGDDHVSTAVVGTVGYAAPEYLESGKLTAKSDVWSFGVVLYELITGRRVLDRNLPRGQRKLLQWVKPYAGDPKKLHVIVDARLAGEYCHESARALAALAERCVQRQPKSRPAMCEAVEILAEIVEAAGGDARAAEPLRLGSGRRGPSAGGEARLFAPILRWGRWTVGLFGSCRARS